MDESDLSREPLLLACEVLAHLVREEWGMPLAEVARIHSSASPAHIQAVLAVEQVFTEDAWKADYPARMEARRGSY